MRANCVRVVLLRSSKPELRERLEVLDADCESETVPRVEDAFDLASGVTGRGLRASDLTFGATSRPKDTSDASEGADEAQSRGICQFSSARGACHRFRDAAHAMSFADPIWNASLSRGHSVSCRVQERLRCMMHTDKTLTNNMCG